MRIIINSLVLCVLLVGSAYSAKSPGLSDHLQFGDPASEKAHRVAIKGDVPVVTMKTRAGPMNFEHVTRELRGRDAEVTFNLQASPSAKAPKILLEIQEVHDRRDVFGYTVSVGGREVYFRTYEEISGGPNHYFVEVDRSLADARGRLEVTLSSRGPAPFNVSQVWLYPDFQALVEEEQIFTRPAFVVGPSADLAGVNGKFDANIEQALGIVNGLKEKYGSCSSFDLGLLMFVGYARRSQEENRKLIDHALDVSAASGVPVHFMFNTWWGAANIGPDGLGGYFSDLQYESVIYNEDTGTFRPSFPNQWGNTLWATKSHPHLNLVNNYMIGVVARYLEDRTAMVRASSPAMPDPVIYAEWGPGFGPDFNPAVIEAARQDGVTLDPRDGLSAEEGHWITESYGAYFARQIPFYHAALGRGHILAGPEGQNLPDNPLIDNIYTHGYWGVGSPLYDRKHAFWQQCMNEGMWCSGELYPWYPQAYYDYILPVSRATCVNLERAVVSDLEFMWTAYGNGLEFVTLFNCKPGDEALLKAVDGLENNPKPVVAYDRRVLDVKYARDRSVENSPGYVSSAGVFVAGARVHPAESGKSGRLVYRIRDAESSFADGLRLEVTGSCGRNQRGDGWSVKVLAGMNPDDLQVVTTLRAGEFGKHKRGGAPVDLSTQARGKKELVVALDLRSDGQREEVEVQEIAAFIPWPRPSGQLDGTSPTLRESRLRSLWMQQRARMERVMRDFRERQGAAGVLRQAEELKQQGRYASARKLLTGEIARTLPARFTIAGDAALDPYPLRVQVAEAGIPVQVELLSVGPEAISFELQAAHETDVTVEFRGLRKGGSYVLRESAPQSYRLAPAGAGDAGVMVARDGSISQVLTARPPHIRPEFPFEPVKRVPLPRKTKAKYEQETGIIRSFKAPAVVGEPCNGIVELESGNKYELGYTPWWTKCEMVGVTDLKSLSLDGIASAFRPGYPVTIEYEPFTFEGQVPRIIRASQPVKTLLNENYVESDDQWTNRAVEVKGLHVRDYRGKKLYPSKNWEPGHVVYRIESDQPFGPTAVSFTGRIIINPVNRVSIFVRSAQGEWINCADFFPSTPGANNWRAEKFVDVTDHVEGRSSFDLKMEIHTMDTSWSSVGSLTVRTLDRSVSSSVD